MLATLGALGVGFFVLRSSGSETLSGAVTIIDDDFRNRDLGDSCTGTGGYGDISPGAGVRLSDGEGNIISNTTLSAGGITGSRRCSLFFEFTDVPNREFYVLAIGNGRRGDLTYSRDELIERDWDVDLTIGDD